MVYDISHIGHDHASRDRMTIKWRIASAYGYGDQSSHDPYNSAGLQPGVCASGFSANPAAAGSGEVDGKPLTHVSRRDRAGSKVTPSHKASASKAATDPQLMPRLLHMQMAGRAFDHAERDRMVIKWQRHGPYTSAGLQPGVGASGFSADPAAAGSGEVDGKPSTHVSRRDRSGSEVTTSHKASASKATADPLIAARSPEWRSWPYRALADESDTCPASTARLINGFL